MDWRGEVSLGDGVAIEVARRMDPDGLAGKPDAGALAHRDSESPRVVCRTDLERYTGRILHTGCADVGTETYREQMDSLMAKTTETHMREMGHGGR